jgi:oligoribonuclease NrnB/cAMP/cGMP phosphodiesterase (DHH superfamily)
MTDTVKEDVVVYYHASCLDGMAAAWVVFAKYGFAELIEADYGDTPHEKDYKDKTVYIVDFSFPLDIMEKIIQDANHTIWLDHHKTARKNLQPILIAPPKKFEFVYATTSSGCLITYEYFYKTAEPPLFLSNISDRDLWLFNLEYTKEVCAFLYTTIKKPENFFEVLSTRYEDMITRGRVILLAQGRVIDQILSNTVSTGVYTGEDGLVYTYAAVNANRPFASDIGDRLSKDYDFVVSWYVDKHNKYLHSLRSSKDRPAAADVSKIAQRYNGGGHKHAAGFKSERRYF